MTHAPNVDPDEVLSQDDEARLYQHDAMPYGDGTSTGERDSTVERDYPSDDAMTRSEEQLQVSTRVEPSGRARLHKYVVTEPVEETVQVRREEARIEREPIADANRDQAMEGPDIAEAEHEVTLHAERPVVEKETVPQERVRLTKDEVIEEETISDELRKERIETEGDVSGRPGEAGRG